ncbi:MAG: hypothetical protein ACOYBR_00200 [Fluviibacter sp.]
MLSMTDLIGCSSLYDCEVEAIAEHEHVSLPIAIGIGEILLGSPEGVCMLHQMVAEDIQHAVDEHDLGKALRFAETYKLVERRHPLPTRLH